MLSLCCFSLIICCGECGELYRAIADEIFRLRNQKQQSLMDTETQKENLKRIKELQDFIAAQATEITECFLQAQNAERGVRMFFWTN